MNQLGSGTWPLFASVLDSAFTAIVQRELSPKMCAEWKVQLEDEIPQGDQALDTQGQSAFICLIGSLDLLIEKDIEDIDLVVNALVDALDNYVYFINKQLVAIDSDGADDYVLMQREYLRQLDDAVFVGAFDMLAREEIICRRVENFQFAVPVAVGALRRGQAHNP